MNTKSIVYAEIGDQFKFVGDPELWDDCFQVGQVLTVTELWDVGVDLDGQPAAFMFREDFEFYRNEGEGDE